MLDGVHRVSQDTLCVLLPLANHHQIQLFDGTRLVPQKIYDAMVQDLGLPARSSSEFAASVARFLKGEPSSARVAPLILPVCDSFRLVGLGALPTATAPWIHPELLSSFAWHTMPELGRDEVIIAATLCVLGAMLTSYRIPPLCPPTFTVSAST